MPSSSITQPSCSRRRRNRSTSVRRRVDREPRSRSGCLTCRRRHKRCDQRSPGCMNCERLNIHCEGYVSVLRWQDRSMQIASVTDTNYHSLRYVNIQSEHYRDYNDEIDTLMELYAPFDVLSDNMELVRPPLDVTCPETDSHSTSYESTNATPFPHTPVLRSHADSVPMNVGGYRTIESLASAPVRSDMTKPLQLSTNVASPVPSSPLSDTAYSASSSGEDFSSPLLDSQSSCAIPPGSVDLSKEAGFHPALLDFSKSWTHNEAGIHPVLSDFSKSWSQNLHAHDLYGLGRTLPLELGSHAHLDDVFFGH
ncbi:hypothetical protein V1517DRAFT_201529 [Lipomyces orientalis]|uniref:Uncharacterized protein n=1 Tax=Lipomyces orientalis TaxID=1233043 RepID=A0ACC3TIB5_9ASCO